MRKLIVLVALGCVVLIGGYLYLFQWGKVRATFESARGYPEAKTPKEAVDLFRKAVQARDYEMAAKYCTSRYAEELRKGAHAAKELGTAIDNLTSQLKDNGVLSDEVKLVLYYYDPFQKDVTFTVDKESADAAEATIAFDGLGGFTQQRPFSDWNLDPRVMRALSYDFPLPGTSGKLYLKKEAGAWKLDVPVSQNQQAATTRINDRYKDYLNPFKIVSQEVKNDPTTKENVKNRLKTLLEEASRN